MQGGALWSDTWVFFSFFGSLPNFRFEGGLKIALTMGFSSLKNHFLLFEYIQALCSPLALGDSASGKTTILKQFLLSYSDAPFKNDLMEWTNILWSNVIETLQQLPDEEVCRNVKTDHVSEDLWQLWCDRL